MGKKCLLDDFQRRAERCLYGQNRLCVQKTDPPEFFLTRGVGPRLELIVVAFFFDFNIQSVDFTLEGVAVDAKSLRNRHLFTRGALQ